MKNKHKCLILERWCWGKKTLDIQTTTKATGQVHSNTWTDVSEDEKIIIYTENCCQLIKIKKPAVQKISNNSDLSLVLMMKQNLINKALFCAWEKSTSLCDKKVFCGGWWRHQFDKNCSEN